MKSVSLKNARIALAIAILAVMTASPAIAGNVTYTYDALGRLHTATYTNGVVITYNYDAAGNRTSVSSGNPSSPGSTWGSITWGQGSWSS